MNSTNLFKGFENQFKYDFNKSFPNSFILRLPDQMSGFYNSGNPCDFIGFANKTLFLLECKSHKGASIPFSDISQADKLIGYVGLPDIKALVILWLYEKDRVLCVPISTIDKMKKDGRKSVGLKAIEEGYNIIEIPSKKKRIFMESDYSILTRLDDNDKLMEE